MENVTLSDLAFWLDDTENDPLWLPAFEALERRDHEPLKKLMLSDYELRPAQRLWLVDFFDRHQFLLAKPGPSRPIWDDPLPRLERIKQWADEEYKRLSKDGVSPSTARDQVLKQFGPLGLTAKTFDDFQNKGGRTRRITRQKPSRKAVARKRRATTAPREREEMTPAARRINLMQQSD